MDKEKLATLQMTCKEAIQKWAERTGEDPTTSKKVSLMACLPSIKKLDVNLNILTACEHLSLSSNQIDRMINLPGLRNLRILSLGRNYLKRIERLEDNVATLEQLWLSYNLIEKLDGLNGCKKLRIIYLSNNMVKNFDELLKLRDLPALEELLLVGNPMYDNMSKEQSRVEVLRRLPKLKKLDGKMITEQEMEAARVDGGET